MDLLGPDHGSSDLEFFKNGYLLVGLTLYYTFLRRYGLKLDKQTYDIAKEATVCIQWPNPNPNKLAFI